MFKWKRNVLLFVSITLIFNTVFTSSSLASESIHSASASVVSDTYSDRETNSTRSYDQHDLEMQAALANNSFPALGSPITPKSDSMQPQVIGTIVRLGAIIFRNIAKGTKVTVKATTRNVVTEVSAHAIERAVERGISGLQMDNILSEKSSGMWAIEKYYDSYYSNSRVMLDRNNKVVIVIDNAANTIITTYKLDSIHTVDGRVSEGRWTKGNFKFR